MVPGLTISRWVVGFGCGTNVCLQDDVSNGSTDRFGADGRRGMAQLPSRVPVGLQDGGVWQVPEQSDHGIFGFDGGDWVGIRFEDCVGRYDHEEGEQDGRRYQEDRSVDSWVE